MYIGIFKNSNIFQEPKPLFGEKLNVELILKILEYLDEENLKNLSKTSSGFKFFSGIALSSQLRFDNIFETHLPETTNKAYSIRHEYYPKIGRLLTNDDIGKKVVRTRSSTGDDWSFVPNEIWKTNNPTLLGIESNGILLLKNAHLIYENDGCWVTEQEFNEHKNSPDFEKREMDVTRKRVNSRINIMQLISLRTFKRNPVKREYYPKIGRLLTNDDIGKKVVRTRPDKHCDWSWVPGCGPVNLTLTKFSEGNTFIVTNSKYKKTYKEQNDGCWVTEQEFNEHKNSPNFLKKMSGLDKTKKPKSLFQLVKRLDYSDFEIQKCIAKANKPKKEPKPVVEQWIDHSFYSPQPSDCDEKESSSSHRSPDFSSKDPYAILGLDPNESSPVVIRSRYKELSLQYHPDKGVPDRSYFQKISQAYEALSESNETFIISDELPYEVLVKNAIKHWDVLRGKKRAFTISEIDKYIPPIQKFVDQLNNIDQKNIEDELMRIFFIKYKEEAVCLLSFYQTKRKIVAITPPDFNATQKEKDEYISDSLKVLNQLDQDIENAPWSVHNLNHYKNVKNSIKDKYLAIQRSRVELHAGKNKKTVSNEVFPFIGKAKKALKELQFKTIRKELEIKRQADSLQKDKAPPPPPAFDSAMDEDKSEEIPDDALFFFEKEKEKKDRFNSEKEKKALKENINKNLTFFKEL